MRRRRPRRRLRWRTRGRGEGGCPFFRLCYHCIKNGNHVNNTSAMGPGGRRHRRHLGDRGCYSAKLSPDNTLAPDGLSFRQFYKLRRYQAMSNFTEAVVANCKNELLRFERGKLPEEDAKVYRRIGEYWRAIPVQGIDGRTKVKDKKGNLYNPAWSSAFISFIARTSGAGAAFHYAEAHCHYIEHGRQAASSSSTSAGYYAVDPYSIVPNVGDIVCAGREYAAQLSFKQAALAYKADRFYPSHGDFVVEVNRNQGYIITVGGNVGSSVREKRLLLSSSGRLVDRTEGSQVLPWLAVMRCRI
jgi:hypothetical protein